MEYEREIEYSKHVIAWGNDKETRYSADEVVPMTRALLAMHEENENLKESVAANVCLQAEFKRLFDIQMKYEADLKEALDVIRFYTDGKNWHGMIGPSFERARDFLVRHEGKGKDGL